MIRRLLPHPALSVLLIVVWMLLVNELGFGALFLALVFGVVVPLVTSRFWPERPKVRFGRDALAYLLIVIFDVIVANFEIAWIILTRRNRDLRSCWLVIPTDLRSAEAITLLAGTISLTPGAVAGDGQQRYLVRWPGPAGSCAGRGRSGCRGRPHQATL